MSWIDRIRGQESGIKQARIDAERQARLAYEQQQLRRKQEKEELEREKKRQQAEIDQSYRFLERSPLGNSLRKMAKVLNGGELKFGIVHYYDGYYERIQASQLPDGAKELIINNRNEFRRVIFHLHWDPPIYPGGTKYCITGWWYPNENVFVMGGKTLQFLDIRACDQSTAERILEAHYQNPYREILPPPSKPEEPSRLSGG